MSSSSSLKTTTKTCVQITDCHVYKDRNQTLSSNVLPYPALESTLKKLKQEISDPDCLLLTGDFTQDDSVEAYREVASLIVKYYPKNQQNGTCWFTPGNHSSLPNLGQVFSDEFEFQGVVYKGGTQKTTTRRDRPGSDVTDGNSNIKHSSSSSSASASCCEAQVVTVVGDEKKETTSKSVTGPFVRQLGIWDVIFLSSHDDNAIHGSLSREDLVWLQTYLKQNNNNKKKPILLAFHHPAMFPECFPFGLANKTASSGKNSWIDSCLVGPSNTIIRDILWGGEKVKNKNDDEEEKTSSDDDINFFTGEGNEHVKLVLHGHLHIPTGRVECTRVAPPPSSSKNKNIFNDRESLYYFPQTRLCDNDDDNNNGNNNNVEEEENQKEMKKKKANAVQIGGPATCHEHRNLGWGSYNLKHGAQILYLEEDGTFSHKLVWADEVFVK